MVDLDRINKFHAKWATLIPGYMRDEFIKEVNSMVVASYKQGATDRTRDIIAAQQLREGPAA